MIEAKEIVIETCNEVVEHYAKRHGLSSEAVRIRIDMENTASKPVFGIFDNSTILERATLKQIVRAGGGGALTMIISHSVQNIIKDIFAQSLKQLELTDSKRIFLILQTKENENGVTFPHISLYKDGVHYWSLAVAEIMDVTMAGQKS